MKIAEFMAQQRIPERVARCEAAKRAAAERGIYVEGLEIRPREQTMHGDGQHFPNLTQRERTGLARAGIDPERSFREFMVELKVQGPPDSLIDSIFGTRYSAVEADERFGMTEAA